MGKAMVEGVRTAPADARTTRPMAAMAMTMAMALAAAACTKTTEGKVSLPDEAPPVQAVKTPEAPEAERGVQVASAGGTVGIEGQAAGTTEESESVAGIATGTQAPREVTARVSGAVVAAKQGQASFQVAGHIARTMAKVGDRVKKGQVLAALDDADYALRGKMAAIQVEQAQIGLEQARRDMERENQLKREGATTQANFERVGNGLAAAQLQLAQAKLNEQQIRDQIADTKLTASYDGVISKRFKVEGEWVGVGNPVFEVSASGEVEVSLRVPEALLRKVSPGQTVALSIPSIDRETEMQVMRIVPVIQENSRTFEVIGKPLRADEAIVPGQFVEAIF